MTKNELIRKLAKRLKVNQAKAEAALDAVVDTIEGELLAGGQVKIMYFGTFKVLHRKAKGGRNPKTGESVKIPAKTVPKFHPSRAFIKAVVKANK